MNLSNITLPGGGLSACRCCGGARLTRVLDLGSQPWGNHFVPPAEAAAVARYPLEVYFCQDCTMLQLGYTVPKELMFLDHNYVSSTTRSLRRHFEEVGERIRTRVDFQPTDFVLDIGGNDGTFLRFFKEAGIGALNVDSGFRQARISQDNGIPCLNRFFDRAVAEEIAASHGLARVIHGSGIFFHLEDLHSVFAGVKRLLAPDGLVVAEFIYLPGMLRQGAFDQVYHEHLLYYSLRSFGDLLGRHGLAIADAELVDIHGGSCVAFITHQDAAAPSERLRCLLALERAAGLDQIAPYLSFARRAERARDTLVAMVRELRASGRTIQALGAPVKGSTIVNYCGFDENDIDAAVEINRLKCGTLVPGTRIPVRHQDEEPAPDVYLLLSWNFKDEILEKLEGFRRGGGRILVPIPQPELI